MVDDRPIRVTRAVVSFRFFSYIVQYTQTPLRHARIDVFIYHSMQSQLHEMIEIGRERTSVRRDSH